MKKLLSILLPILVAGCSACTGALREHVVEEPSFTWGRYEFWGVLPLNPPQLYMAWYTEAGSCAGAVGIPFEGIMWFTADSIIDLQSDPDSESPISQSVAGLYWQKQIYLSVATGSILDKKYLKHEMLHYMGFTHNHIWLWLCSGYLKDMKDVSDSSKTPDIFGKSENWLNKYKEIPARGVQGPSPSGCVFFGSTRDRP
jgi:hypothetical protein